jgi:hypothetical protein
VLADMFEILKELFRDCCFLDCTIIFGGYSKSAVAFDILLRRSSIEKFRSFRT